MAKTRNSKKKMSAKKKLAIGAGIGIGATAALGAGLHVRAAMINRNINKMYSNYPAVDEYTKALNRLNRYKDYLKSSAKR